MIISCQPLVLISRLDLSKKEVKHVNFKSGTQLVKKSTMLLLKTIIKEPQAPFWYMMWLMKIRLSGQPIGTKNSFMKLAVRHQSLSQETKAIYRLTQSTKIKQISLQDPKVSSMCWHLPKQVKMSIMCSTHWLRKWLISEPQLKRIRDNLELPLDQYVKQGVGSFA